MSNPYARLNELMAALHASERPADLDSDAFIEALTATARLVGYVECMDVAATDATAVREGGITWDEGGLDHLRDLTRESGDALRRRLDRLERAAREDRVRRSGDYRVDGDLR